MTKDQAARLLHRAHAPVFKYWPERYPRPWQLRCDCGEHTDDAPRDGFAGMIGRHAKHRDDIKRAAGIFGW